MEEGKDFVFDTSYEKYLYMRAMSALKKIKRIDDAIYK